MKPLTDDAPAVVELDLAHPKPRLRLLMRVLGFLGLAVICATLAVGLVLFVLNTLGLAELPGLMLIKEFSRWIISGLLLAAIGFWDL